MSDDNGNTKPETANPETVCNAGSAPDAQPAAAPRKHKKIIPVTAPAQPQIDRTSRLSILLHRLSSMRVSYKIAGTFILILIPALVSLGIVTFTRQNAILQYEMKSRAQTLVEQLASVGKEGLLTKQELPVFSTITDIRQREGVVYAFVVDDEGRVFAHSDLSQKGLVLNAPADQAAGRATALLFQQVESESDSILDAALPVQVQSKGLKIGLARIGLSQKELKAAIRAQMITYLWIALGFVGAGLLVSFALARVLTKPLDSLEKGIQVVARGDLRKLVTVRYNDEIGRLTQAFNQMILSLREKLLMEKYLSQSTVLSIKEHRDVTQLMLGGERKYVTALFSDARGFTSLSEKMTPEEVVSLMNIYLNLQTSVIHHFGGIVDKFVGDEVMAIFEGRGEEINAVRAAVEIQNYCRSLNAARTAAGEKIISIGIGLNSGEVVMGNMGSEDHMDYTVIGDSINVAARMCGIAQPGTVLISKAVAEAIGDQATYKELRTVTVKGKDQPIGVAEVMAVKGGSRHHMRKSIDAPVTYTLEGFSDETYDAKMKNISPGGCLLQVPSPIGIGSKLKLNVNLIAFGNITVRVAVYHARKQDGAYFIGLSFEDMPEAVKNEILHWVHRVNSEIVDGLIL